MCTEHVQSIFLIFNQAFNEYKFLTFFLTPVTPQLWLRTPWVEIQKVYCVVTIDHINKMMTYNLLQNISYHICFMGTWRTAWWNISLTDYFFLESIAFRCILSWFRNWWSIVWWSWMDNSGSGKELILQGNSFFFWYFFQKVGWYQAFFTIELPLKFKSIMKKNYFPIKEQLCK